MAIKFKYVLEEIRNLSQLMEYQQSFVPMAREINECFGTEFDLKNFDILGYVSRWNTHIVVAWKDYGTMSHGRRDRELVGVLMASVHQNVFDSKALSVHQDLLYVREGHPRAARLIFQDLIDFGKRHANHVITCVTPKTNIKPATLEKMGFELLESSYRLEL